MENPFDNLLIDLAEHHLNPYLHRLGWITPNIITTASLITGILAAFLMHTKQYKGAAVAYLLSYFLDCADGNYAWKYNMVTAFGDMYDHIADILKMVLILAVIAYSQHVKFRTRVLLITVIICFLILAMIHMGCQERAYNRHESASLSSLKHLCNANDERAIYITRFFGLGTVTFVIIVILLMFDQNVFPKGKKIYR